MLAPVTHGPIQSEQIIRPERDVSRATNHETGRHRPGVGSAPRVFIGSAPAIRLSDMFRGSVWVSPTAALDYTMFFSANGMGGNILVIIALNCYEGRYKGTRHLSNGVLFRHYPASPNLLRRSTRPATLSASLVWVAGEKTPGGWLARLAPEWPSSCFQQPMFIPLAGLEPPLRPTGR